MTIKTQTAEIMGINSDIIGDIDSFGGDISDVNSGNIIVGDVDSVTRVDISDVNSGDIVADVGSFSGDTVDSGDIVGDVDSFTGDTVGDVDSGDNVGVGVGVVVIEHSIWNV
eukprot:784353_1